jgi:hypothetical protein
MAQIHAVLLVICRTINQDDIMAQLNISRGNVNMNILRTYRIGGW